MASRFGFNRALVNVRRLPTKGGGRKRRNVCNREAGLDWSKDFAPVANHDSS